MRFGKNKVFFANCIFEKKRNRFKILFINIFKKKSYTKLKIAF